MYKKWEPFFAECSITIFIYPFGCASKGDTVLIYTLSKFIRFYKNIRNIHIAVNGNFTPRDGQNHPAIDT